MNTRNLCGVLLLTFCFSVATKFYSQSAHVAGVFPTIDHSGLITDKLSYSLYYFAALPIINFQNPDIKKDAWFHLFYAEQAVSFHPKENFSLTGSYVYQRENVVYPNAVNENRFYMQAKYKQPALNLTHRLRFDGRFIQNPVTGKSPFTHRLRYLIGTELNMNKANYLALYEEAFFNTFKDAPCFFGENWAYVGIGNKLNKNHKLEMGLLYVTWFLSKQSWFNQYYFQLTWSSQLDFRKPKSE